LNDLSAEAPMPPIPPKVPVGLPSEIVRRRPDIRRAEANLHAATARIGVATADLFPKFSITGSLGLQGSSVSALSTMGDRFWSIGPSVTWPIFTAGKIQANIDLQRAITDESYAAYQKTVLTALQEVETALVIYTKEQERRDALADAVAANREAVDLSTQLYSAGRTDFLNVLTAQRGLFDAENTLSLSEQVLVVDLITLYKALGGGWEEGADGEDGIRAPVGPAPEQQ
jgi:outer membrane protein, multidrug efflux system